jgi:hypothetical protein
MVLIHILNLVFFIHSVLGRFALATIRFISFLAAFLETFFQGGRLVSPFRDGGGGGGGVKEKNISSQVDIIIWCVGEFKSTEWVQGAASVWQPLVLGGCFVSCMWQSLRFAAHGIRLPTQAYIYNTGLIACETSTLERGRHHLHGFL